MRNLFFICLASVVALAACQSTPTKPSCGDEVRAGFDVGSGSTKLKVVKFNTCTGTVVSTLATDQVKVDYRDSLEKSDNQEFSTDIKTSGKEGLKKLKIIALGAGASKFSGVATAAFRQAKNAEQFVQEIKQELGISIRIIPQSEEALLGFKAAAGTTTHPLQQVIVWDIGGGSMQITSMSNADKPDIYFGQLASVSFKNRILEEIQKKNIKKVSSPNPLKPPQVTKAMKMAELSASKTVPVALQQKLPTSEVLGISGVLTRSITKHIPGKNQITLLDLNQAIKKSASLSDKELGGEFAATEVTNMILVAGYMKALGVKYYVPTEASLVDAIWTDETYW